MTLTSDPVRAAGLVAREIRRGTRDGRPTKIAIARRRYAAERPDVWDALTNAERIPRWFLPISGDLVVGGHYQLEGNASGVVERCTEPESFAVTWEFNGQVSWVQVHLGETDGDTTLELVHEAHVDPDLWAQFGPGAVGIGWDLALLGLAQHLAGAALDPAEGAAWPLSPDGTRFVRLAGEGWAQAAIADGDDPEQARAAATRTVAFYTTAPEEAPEG
ncbi:SRPBCC family protein [Micromonospora sp. CB01531]|uniref:SRPBCC family protein n=1 Tax=Micromonospora sp. CB01531 TaxID=1718947 RepID=UPI00093E4CC7|nr:SRPBCC family protein [Micromonospora sp. CB01531]OKI87599.1 polyketide cyclase [Micromonospora sp. CB01531]